MDPIKLFMKDADAAVNFGREKQLVILYFAEKNGLSRQPHAYFTEVTDNTPEYMRERGYPLIAEFDNLGDLFQKWVESACGPYRATMGDKLRVWGLPECGYTGLI